MYLIYELFSGVGFCNQLFSLETAIYLSNITNRKLILIVKHPLCHCGKASWDYGKFLDFFNDDYKYYLPNGLDVYYKNVPESIINIINSTECKTIPFISKLSHLAIIDKNLNTSKNKESIKKFCNFRTECVLDLTSYTEKYLYTNKSNASRCFYNFYTTQANYNLMSNICESLTHLHNVFNIINFNINYKYICLHLRLGDMKHDKHHIDSLSLKYYSDLKDRINKVNSLISTSNKINNYNNIIVMADRQDGKILELLKKDYNIIETSELIKNINYKNHFKNINNSSVIEFLIQKQLCKDSEYFIGCEGSTVSNYIQYIHYINDKTHNLYTSRELNCDKKEFFTWNYNPRCDGNSLAFKLFFPDNINTRTNLKIITLTNDGYKEMTDNLLISMKKLGISKLLKIYCIGTDSYSYFKNKYPFNDVIKIDVNKDYLTGWVQYKSIQNPDLEGKKKWATITSYKIYCINNELKMNNDVIFIDGDIVFEKNPFTYLVNNIKNYDLLIQNDNQLEEKCAFCTGFFYMRCNDKTKEITDYKKIVNSLENFQNDQQYLRTYENNLNVCYLPLELFPNGKFWRDNIPPDPYIIHFNYDVHNQKISRMKQYNKWYINSVINVQKELNYDNTYHYNKDMPFKDWIKHKFPVNEIIINASVEDGSDSFTNLPLGVQHDYLKYHNAKNNNEFLNHPQCNLNMCLISMNKSTDKNRRNGSKVNRNSISNILSNKTFIDYFKSDSISYFKEIGKYKFVICPEGNGIDTHRLWETLYSKGIPIVEKNPNMYKKLEGLPILWTVDYSEINEKYLDFKYKEISMKSYDFSKLYLNSYNDMNRNTILSRSKYWCNKKNLLIFYNNYYNNNDLYNSAIHKYYGLKDNNGIELDKKLDTLFNYQDNGIFIDVGAHDGINQSNTCFFEKTRKWNGVLITPNKDKYNECIINRNNSITNCVACVSPEYTSRTIEGDFWRLNGSINCYRSKSKTKETVDCATLTEILDSNLKIFKSKYSKNLKDGIDLLNIDTSAFEYDVISGLDLNKYNVEFILIEILIENYNKVTEYLLNNGYKLVSNFSNYNKHQNKKWDGTHNDYLFKKTISKNQNIQLSITNKNTKLEIFNYKHLFNKNKILLENHLLELENIINKCNVPLEGNIFYNHQGTRWNIGDKLVRNPNFIEKQLNMYWCGSTAMEKICEIGFNAGHSCLLMLLSKTFKNLTFTIFDIVKHKYTMPCFNYIENNFSNINFELIKGDSVIEIPKWIDNNTGACNTYDIVHIDGGHSEECIKNDFINADKLVKHGGTIIIDDTDSTHINNFVNKYLDTKLYIELDILDTGALKKESYSHRIIKKI